MPQKTVRKPRKLKTTRWDTADYLRTKKDIAAYLNAALEDGDPDLLKTALPQGGKIILCVGYPNAQNAKDRIQGIQNGLAGSKIQIIDTLADDTKTAAALKNAQDALAKYPDLACMVGLYSYNGPAILTAVRGAGKVGKVQIVPKFGSV